MFSKGKKGGLVNHTVFLLGEYHSRRKLKELGYVSDLEDLDPVTAEIFCEISNVYAEINEEKAERDRLKRGRR